MKVTSKTTKVEYLIREYRSLVAGTMKQLTAGDYRAYLQSLERVNTLAKHIEDVAPRKIL